MALIVLLPVAVIVQQLVEMYRPAGIESGLVSGALPPPSKAAGVCVNPAPVRLLAGGTPPAAFVVTLAARDDQEGASLTTTLARKYQLSTSGYQRSKRAFATVLPPDVIRQLRCEGSVKSIEEDRAVGSRRGRPKAGATAGAGLAPRRH